jgi:hypothetical protein
MCLEEHRRFWIDNRSEVHTGLQWTNMHRGRTIDVYTGIWSVKMLAIIDVKRLSWFLVRIVVRIQ